MIKILSASQPLSLSASQPLSLSASQPLSLSGPAAIAVAGAAALSLSWCNDSCCRRMQAALPVFMFILLGFPCQAVRRQREGVLEAHEKHRRG